MLERRPNRTSVQLRTLISAGWYTLENAKCTNWVGRLARIHIKPCRITHGRNKHEHWESREKAWFVLSQVASPQSSASPPTWVSHCLTGGGGIVSTREARLTKGLSACDIVLGASVEARGRWQR